MSNNHKNLSAKFRPFYCPIPNEQKPINEYIQLKNKLNEKQFIISSRFFLIFFIIYKSLSFYINEKSIIFLILFNILIYLINFLFLYLQIKELAKKLFLCKIFYEEGSWFNIEYWEKFFFLIKNDRLLLIQKIRPTFKKQIQAFLSVMCYFIILLILIAINNFLK